MFYKFILPTVKFFFCSHPVNQGTCTFLSFIFEWKCAVKILVNRNLDRSLGLQYVCHMDPTI